MKMKKMHLHHLNLKKLHDNPKIEENEKKTI